MEKEQETIMKDLKSYKERCKDFEIELQQLRGFENSIGNQSKLKTNSYDMEIKQVRDKFTKQLNKAKEKEGIYIKENNDLKERIKILE